MDVGEIFRVHRRPPGGRRELVRRRSFGRARRIDEHVDRPEPRLDRGDDALSDLGIDKIGRKADHARQFRQRRIDVGLRA